MTGQGPTLGVHSPVAKYCFIFDVLLWTGVAVALAFMTGPGFADNPIGVEFDPYDWVRRLQAGEPEGNFLIRTVHQPVAPRRNPVISASD